jgi:hypothetical protein
MKNCGCNPPYLEANKHQGGLYVPNLKDIVKKLYLKFNLLEKEVDYLKEHSCTCDHTPDIPDIPDSSTPDNSITEPLSVTTNTAFNDIEPSTGDTYNISVVTNYSGCSISFTSSDWITISPSTGTESTIYKVTINANDSLKERNGYITIIATRGSEVATKTLDITQAGKAISEVLIIDPETITFNSDSEESVYITYTTRPSYDYSEEEFELFLDETETNADGTYTTRYNISPINLCTEIDNDITVVITFSSGSLSKTLTLIQKAYKEEGGGDGNEGDNNNGDNSGDNNGEEEKPNNDVLKLSTNKLEFSSASDVQYLIVTSSQNPTVTNGGSHDYFDCSLDSDGVNADGTAWTKYKYYITEANTTGSDVTATEVFKLGSLKETLTLVLKASEDNTPDTPTPDTPSNPETPVTTSKYSYFKSNSTVTASAINLTETGIKQWTRVTKEVSSESELVNVTDTVEQEDSIYFFGVAVPSNWTISFVSKNWGDNEISNMTKQLVNITDPNNTGSTDTVEYAVYYYKLSDTDLLEGTDTFTMTITNV